MGFLTVAQIRAEILANVGNRPVDTFGTSSGDDAGGKARLNLYIDQTILELMSMRLLNNSYYQHRSLEETTTQALVTNQRNYTSIPPTAVQTPTFAIHSVRIFNPAQITRGWRLDPIRDREEFERRIQLPSLPRYYAIFGSLNEIQLAPPPHLTYNGWTLEIRRRRYPRITNVYPTKDDVTAGVSAQLGDSDTLDFSAAWDEPTILGATARAFRTLALTQLSQDTMLEFQRVAADVARRAKVEAEDLDYGPPVEMPYFQMPY